jgi:hypothetical protein
MTFNISFGMEGATKGCSRLSLRRAVRFARITRTHRSESKNDSWFALFLFDFLVLAWNSNPNRVKMSEACLVLVFVSHDGLHEYKDCTHAFKLRDAYIWTWVLYSP